MGNLLQILKMLLLVYMAFVKIIYQYCFYSIGIFYFDRFLIQRGDNKLDKNTILQIIAALLILGLVYFCYSLHKTNSQLSKDLAANTQQLESLLKVNGDLTTQLAQAKKDYMELGSNVSSSTQVVYVEKSSPNDADVEVNKSIPKVIVNAGDGKSFEFTPTSESKEVIKDGKVVITEDNTLTIDIEKITDARFKDRVDALNAKH